MKAEKPAQSISRSDRWNDVVVYNIDCECTDPDHSVQTWIEIGHDEEFPAEVEVTFYVQTNFTRYRSWLARIATAWRVLVGGEVQQSHSLLLKEQGAKNFAAAIEQTIEDLQNAKDSQSDT